MVQLGERGFAQIGMTGGLAPNLDMRNLSY